MTNTILFLCFIGTLVFLALVPMCRSEKTDWHQYAEDEMKNNPDEWEIPEWAYIGTDVLMDEEEE